MKYKDSKRLIGKDMEIANLFQENNNPLVSKAELCDNFQRNILN